MSSELINQLSKLKLEKASLKRNLDRNYYNLPIRTKMFHEIRKVNQEINKVKFKLRLERENKK